MLLTGSTTDFKPHTAVGALNFFQDKIVRDEREIRVRNLGHIS